VGDLTPRQLKPKIEKKWYQESKALRVQARVTLNQVKCYAAHRAFETAPGALLAFVAMAALYGLR
jgi:hypothetical protein